MSWSSRRAPVFFFFQNFHNALLSFLSYWLLKSFAFYSMLSLLFYDVCKMACLCDTCRNSHLQGDVRSPVEVLPEGLSFIQLRKSHWTRASMHLPCTHHDTPPCLHPLRVCLCGCIFVCLWERKPGSYFLRIIKTQIQSPHASLKLFDCLKKPQCVSSYVWHFVQMCVCGGIVRCQRAP